MYGSIRRGAVFSVLNTWVKVMVPKIKLEISKKKYINALFSVYVSLGVLASSWELFRDTLYV